MTLYLEVTLSADWVTSRSAQYPIGTNVIISKILLDVYLFLYEEGKIRQET